MFTYYTHKKNTQHIMLSEKCILLTKNGLQMNYSHKFARHSLVFFFFRFRRKKACLSQPIFYLLLKCFTHAAHASHINILTRIHTHTHTQTRALPFFFFFHYHRFCTSSYIFISSPSLSVVRLNLTHTLPLETKQY